MMNNSKTKLLIPIIGGSLLIAVGVIFLLEALEIFQFNFEMLIGPIFGLGGLVFLLVFVLNRKDWWAIIPGLILIAIGFSIFMGQNVDNFIGRWGGMIFLGFLGLAFLLIFITHPENWWAIIPAGVLMTMAGVSTLEANERLQGGLLFLGLAITFGLVYILPKPDGKIKWALYPAGILLFIGIAVFLGVENLINYVWPFALLLGGGYIIYRALKKGK
jgi:hypothetical protein